MVEVVGFVPGQVHQISHNLDRPSAYGDGVCVITRRSGESFHRVALGFHTHVGLYRSNI
jgi:hypothetical protein